MTATNNYEFYISLIACILLAIFFFTGSIVAFKSKRNLCSPFLMVSSGIGLIAVFSSCYLAIQFNKILSASTTGFGDDYMNKVEDIAKYQNISSYTLLFSYCLFAFIFVIFCSSIANIRKRNEQLEFLVEQLKENR